MTSGEQAIVARRGKAFRSATSWFATANFDPKDAQSVLSLGPNAARSIFPPRTSQAARQAGSMGLLAKPLEAGPTIRTTECSLTFRGRGYGYPGPFGWAYYSPLTVSNYYNYYYGNYGGGYYNNVGAGPRVGSSVSTSAPVQRGVDTASARVLVQWTGPVAPRQVAESPVEVASRAGAGGGGGGGRK